MVGRRSAGCPVTRWAELAQSVPEFAAALRSRFESHKHCLIATVRAGGAPRLSGIEAWFWEGDLMLGMMPASRKADDLERDGRFELHSAPTDLELTEPDARIWGSADREADPAAIARFADSLPYEGDPGPMVLFRCALEGAALIRAEGDELVIESWTPHGGMRRQART